MKFSLAALLTMATMASMAAGCADATPNDEASASVAEDTTAVPVITIKNTSIVQSGPGDILRRTPGQQVILRNSTKTTKHIVLYSSNVIQGAADYAQATKLDILAGGSIRLGGTAHPLNAGANFLGFNAPNLASGFKKFALFTVWVGQPVAGPCNITTAAIGTDECPAWGIDADFCTCTPALPGGG